MWHVAFMDELEKIALSDQRKRDLSFAGMGAVAGPVIAGTTNLIQQGRVVPKNLNPGRWLAGAAASGALFSGALPVVRRAIDSKLSPGAPK